MQHDQNKKSTLSKLHSVWILIREAGTAVQILGILGLAIGPAIAAAISSWAYLEGAPWPVLSAIFIGLTLISVGFAHYFLYFTIPKFIEYKANNKEKIHPKIDNDWGLLDYDAEGNRRIVRSTKMVQRVAKGMNEVRIRAKSATRTINFSLSPEKKLKKAALLAGAVESHIAIIDEAIIYFDESIPIIKTCFSEVIARSPTGGLRRLTETMGSVYITSMGTADIIRAYANAYKQIKGISKSINIAIDKANPKITEFTYKIELFGEMCQEIKLIGEAKLRT